MPENFYGNEAAFALRGLEIITDTAAHTGNFYLFHAFTACVITAITAPNASGNTLEGITIPAGHDLILAHTSITLTSGTGYSAKR